jgi:cysteine synthase A
MAKYDNILGTVGHTPVVRINKLAPPHVKLYVKVEAFNPMGSVKDRLALGVIEDAERTGKLRPGQTVIEATSGNTGIGLAMVCAQKGYPLVVTMAESFSIERRRLMRFLGAKVVLTPAALKGSGMLAKAVELAEKHGWFLTRQFENEANADMHSRTTAREILADFADERLDYFVTGYGTGGTLKGVARVLRQERPQTKIVVCEPDNVPLLGSGLPQPRDERGGISASHPSFRPHPMQGWTPDFIPKLTEDAVTLKLTDQVLPVGGEDAMRMSRELARKEGIFCGITAGATFAGALKIAESAPEGSTILAMLPDTGERYLSTPLFADVPADMTEEELAISRSTPNYRFDAPPPASGAAPASSAPPAGSAPPAAGGGPAPAQSAGAQPSGPSTQLPALPPPPAAEAQAFVERVLGDKEVPVVMFALEWCEYTWGVRKMFAHFGVPFRSVDLDSAAYQKDGSGAAIRAVVSAKTSIPTIPQIFVGGTFIGGASDTLAAWKDGRLQKLLEQANVKYNTAATADPMSFLPGWQHPR